MLKRVIFKFFLKAVRVILRLITFLRRPKLLFDPSLLVWELWGSDLVVFADTERRGIKETIRLLVIIPFRNKWHLTEKALNSLCSQDLAGIDLTIALVDNGSDEQTVLSTKSWITQFHQTALKVRYFRYDKPFNFSAMNNQAVKDCGGSSEFDNVLFLNNDVELIGSDTLQVFKLNSERIGNTLGAMSCTLLYSNKNVQHSFVAPGVVIVGAHLLKGIRFRENLKWFLDVRKVPAVTGALLWMHMSRFEQIGLFDEQLATAYQDVDLCLKASKIGLQNVTIAPLKAFHHESVTRKQMPPFEEALYIYNKWGSWIAENPLVPRRLSRWSEFPVFSFGEPRFPWKLLLNLVAAIGIGYYLDVECSSFWLDCQLIASVHALFLWFPSGESLGCDF